MRLVLRDLDPEVVLALTQTFGDVSGVTVGAGDLLEAGVDAVVVPIQGVSSLDGGFVAACRARFRVQAWSHLKVLVDRSFDGTLPVGEAVLVSTGLRGVLWMIAAPARHTEEFIGARVHADGYGRIILPGPDHRLATDREHLARAGTMLQQAHLGETVRDPVVGARLALLAALRVAAGSGESIRFLGCPGLGTGAAGGDPWQCAAAMKEAWTSWNDAEHG